MEIIIYGMGDKNHSLRIIELWQSLPYATSDIELTSKGFLALNTRS